MLSLTITSTLSQYVTNSYNMLVYNLVNQQHKEENILHVYTSIHSYSIVLYFPFVSALITAVIVVIM